MYGSYQIVCLPWIVCSSWQFFCFILVVRLKSKSSKFNRCHPFLLVKVCHMLLKSGLMLVMYGAGKWAEGQTRLDIFMIDTFIFRHLFIPLVAIYCASKASPLLSGTSNQIFRTWKLKNSLVYLAGRSRQLSEVIQKVSPKQFFFDFAVGILWLFLGCYFLLILIFYWCYG